jgi:hypothetical protein
VGEKDGRGAREREGGGTVSLATRRFKSSAWIETIRRVNSTE